MTPLIRDAIGAAVTLTAVFAVLVIIAVAAVVLS